VPNDYGSGVFPKIENTEIVSILDYLFYVSIDVSRNYEDDFYRNDIDLEMIGGELIIFQTKSFYIDECDDSDDSVECDDSDFTEKDNVKNFIEYMIEHGNFEDQSYEFEEDEIK
jgi:hypothetical protein